MTVYADTSAIVKLYVAEEGSERVRSRLAGAAALFTCRLAYVEARAALAAARRLERLDEPGYARAVSAFERDWKRYHVIEVTPSLIEMAGGLAERHALRGYDAVHLAAALALNDRLAADGGLIAFDAELARAAASVGLRVL